jgi:hypothetical protein
MYAFRLRAAAIALATGLGLAGCTTPYGSGISLGYGNGYDPYYANGYGYGAGYGYPGYGAGYPGYGYGMGYPGYGYGFSPYWGWYDGFYYPGTGYYVYDRDRHPHDMNDDQKSHWFKLRERALATTTTRSTSQPVVIRENWSDFSRDRSTTRRVRIDRNANRIESSQTTNVEGSSPVRIERQRRERTRPVHVERSSGAAETSFVNEQRSTVRAARQEARELRRSEMRAARASRSEAHESRKSSDE